uniref:Queuine tRNA-ribosyltransferase catalytic subunit 1 n=1 Tax=Phaeomonas parva TaxID=124430 RepID=A0A7S1XYW6_9STRA|mmetsp:Transcript_46349/g.145006  ORF Transcript_46349/g.145006 Transcript_46349/m.145006 type:complete len:476 (+) Transcript_46349:165-1592(+)
MTAEDAEQLKLTPEGTAPVFTDTSPALCHHVHATAKMARACTLHLPHGPVQTPIFMPVGTKGTIKALSSRQLESLPEGGPKIILANTYHMALQPGTELLDELGGLHKFMSWKRNLLTDSGGFQMVSLCQLMGVNEEGVTFKSPYDGSEMLLRPEDSIRHQNNIGSDIMMQLDDVVSSVSVDDARFVEACDRSVRWLDRCIAAHAKPRTQNLFAIIQGGLDVRPGGLRERCLKAMIARDTPGYAIGGLAGGEDKEEFWRVVHMCTKALPRNKPRYLMGVGYPLDLVVCVSLGVDMFDCVFPTRAARFGVALVDGPGGQLKLKWSACGGSTKPVMEGCDCACCKRYTRAFLHQAFKADPGLAGQILTQHNVAYMLGLSRSMRAAIVGGEWEPFVRRFLSNFFAAQPLPKWVFDALSAAGVEVDAALRLDVARAELRPAAADEEEGGEARAKRRRVEGDDPPAPEPNAEPQPQPQPKP